MQVKPGSFIFGLTLLILGILLLFQNFGYLNIDFGQFWPIILMIIGIGFWVAYWQNRNKQGYIMPATVFCIYGLMFLYDAITLGSAMSFLWPFFLIAPGIGFLLMYSLGEKQKDLLMPAVILILLGALFLIKATGMIRWWPLLLIASGLYLIFKKKGEAV